ncbi:MAG: hypothetical protein NXI32_09720 [bacterium]|nr:hypothetical protein [bacterium]
MRRALAKLWIDFASDVQNLPVWVREMVERDVSVRAHFLSAQQLEKRLRQDRDAWLESSKAAPGLLLDQHPRRSGSKPNAGGSMPARWRLPFDSAVRCVFPVAACLGLLLVCWWLWGDRQTAQENWEAAVRQAEVRADASSPNPVPSAVSNVDWRPLLAAASAGQQVTHRITESTGEWILNATDVAGQAMRGPINAGSALPDELWSESKAGVRAALRPLTLMLNLGQAEARAPD